MHLKFFLPMVFAISASTGFCASVDYVGSSAPFAIEHTTEIPGNELKAGSYSVSVTEQIADRMIVRIDSVNSTNHALFLGVPSTPAKIGGNAGAVTWTAGVNKSPTLRGFVFPNGNAVEFVYPKAEAAALAKDNSAVVVAVDPRSQGMVSLKSLSHDELLIVNLWLLSLTSTGPDNRTPAVLARHYDATQDRQSTVAAVTPPAQQPTPVQTQASAPVAQRLAVNPSSLVTRQTPVASTSKIAQRAGVPQPLPQANHAAAVRLEPSAAPQVAKVEEPALPGATVHPTRQTTVIAQLPHTASFLPVVWMIGLLSLLGAGLARVAGWKTQRVVS